MHDFYFETGPAAFLAGLAVSPHCAGMCAPISCALAPWPGTTDTRMAFATAQHTVRVFAYALLGALAGGAGMRWGRVLDLPTARALPWAILLFYVLIALGVSGNLPLPGFLRRLNAALFMRVKNLPAPVAGAALGAATPLIPCGPLHGMLALAFLSASAARGAEIAAGFALGTLPLLWAAQAGFFSLRLKLGAPRMALLRKTAAFAAAGIMLVRILFTDTNGSVCG